MDQKHSEDSVQTQQIRPRPVRTVSPSPESGSREDAARPAAQTKTAQRTLPPRTGTARPTAQRTIPPRKKQPEKEPAGKKEGVPGAVKGLMYYGFFPLSLLYLEVILRLFVSDARVFDGTLPYVVFFSLAYGGFLWFIGNVIPARKAARIVEGVLLGAVTVFVCINYCLKSFFGFYYSLSAMLRLGGDAATQFAGNTVAIIFSSLGFIILAFMPMLIYVFQWKYILPDRITKLRFSLIVLALAILLRLGVGLTANFAGNRAVYRGDYDANAVIPRFGVLTGLRLEVKNAIFGSSGSGEELDNLLSDAKDQGKIDGLSGPDGEPVTQTETREPEPVVYDPNVMDIDFAALAASTSNDTLKSLDQIFLETQPTKQNPYTGLFKGKNLIVLTCEAFSPYVIREDLTPTLYKLSHEGFVFNNFYQPDWTQSTTGGEFAAMSGIVPTWVGGAPAFYGTVGHAMPFALGNQFRSLGYATRAYHNNAFDYYNRDKTHPNMGYDYKGIGNGLVLENRYGWPESDLEMMKATVSEYVDEYAATGKLFHTYYMTVSGHCNYGWNVNNMSKKNRAVTENMPYSETVQAYLACQLEVEYAVKYIVDYCAEKGVLDDVVIMLTSDHYPYAMTQNSGTDYYQELEPQPYSEKTTERYRNTLILWSSSMKEPVVVDDPCSSIDMVPTISNLFGLKYDSRILSGRDILDSDYDVTDPASRQPFVVFVDKGPGVSWVTCAGVYNAYTKTFTPNEGYESFADSQDYINAMTKKAQNMCKVGKLLVSSDYYAHVFQ